MGRRVSVFLGHLERINGVLAMYEGGGAFASFLSLALFLSLFSIPTSFTDFGEDAR